MKKKLLGANSRKMLAMAIKNTAKTRIYLVAENQNGLGYYQSKRVFTKSTANKYLSNGQYSVVFAGGIEKSSVTDWL
tara:strand:- start:467 stop:697 length:231 start_codon:yes stop_codon:yes gene_type:complete